MKKGLLLAVGDYPEGNATASRLNLLSRTLSEGGLKMTVGLIHGTVARAPSGQPGVRGRWGDVDFRYFNDRVTRPANMPGQIVDTARGMSRAARYVKAQARNGDLDFLILYTPNMLKSGPALRAALSQRVPVFLEACEIRSQTTGAVGRPRLRTRLVNLLDKRIENNAHSMTEGVIAISTGIADFFAARGVARENIFHLPILVDREPYLRPVHDSVDRLHPGRFLFNSGTFAEKDGIAFVVRAFERILGDHSDAVLAFSGSVDAATRARVTGYAERNSTADQIVFTGYLSREQLIWCYQNAAALLSCRSNSAYAHFGFPTKLAEYLSSGTCVIATDVGDIRRYLSEGESAWIAQPEDIESIAATFRKVFSEPQRAKQIGLEGQNVSEVFDYRSYTDTLTRFIVERTGPAS